MKEQLTAKPGPFDEMKPRHPTFVLLWELDAKTRRPIRPFTTFTPDFPGQGFNHSVQLLPEAGAQYSLPCPCGTAMNFTAQRPAGTRPANAVVVCPKCESWHNVIWVPPAGNGPKIELTFC